MYRFDSRFMRQYDSVTKQFTESGEFYSYMAIHAKLSKKPALDNMTYIEVGRKASNKPVQHRVTVSYDKASHSFVSNPRSLAVNKGDTVQWHKPKNDSIGYYVTVLDQNGDPVFNSQSLTQHNVFTHFFSHPGEYRYRNILSNSSQRPLIKVYQVDPSKEDWETLSTTPKLIRYKNGKFTPDKIMVPEGGTVIWFIEDSEPVAIQLSCYDLYKIDPDMIPRPPRGNRGCKPDSHGSDCGK